MRRKFIAAKVNINGGIFSANLQTLIQLIPEAIKSYPFFQNGKQSWKWSFAEIGSSNEDTIVFGYFVKSRKERKLVLKGDKTEYFEIPDPAAYRSFFIYQYVDEILVFEETSQITREDFVFAFEKLIYNSKYEINEIAVKLLPIKEVIYKEIEKMEVLTKIEFDLVHSNPISGDTYKDLDDIIHKERATKLKAVLENPNGLNKNGSMITSGIEMASHGYGGVNAYGYSRVASRGKGKKTRKVSQKFKSRDSVHMTHVDREIGEGDLISKLKDFALAVKNLLF
jgi:hypothetical protein